MSKFTFPHHKLEAWHLACRARRDTHFLIQAVPKGFAADTAQIRRSAQAVPKLIAEGASRWSKGTKRVRFDEALGEIGETAAALEGLVAMGVLDAEKTEAVVTDWGRCRAMVLGLLRHVARG